LPRELAAPDDPDMRIRVTWPNGNEREVEVHSLRELDRFVGWHMRDGQRCDLKPDGDGLHLVVIAD
jgi:hypothetical protein